MGFWTPTAWYSVCLADRDAHRLLVCLSLTFFFFPLWGCRPLSWMPWLEQCLVCTVLLKCVLWLTWCGFFPLFLCAQGLQSWWICLEVEGTHCLHHRAPWEKLLQGHAADLPGPGGVLCFGVFSDWQCSGMSWAFTVEQKKVPSPLSGVTGFP